MSKAIVKSEPAVLAAPAVWVEFKGLFKVRLLLDDASRRRIVPNDIAAALGLRWTGLHDRIRRKFGKGIRVMRIPSQGGIQPTTTLDLHYLPAVLLGIEVSRVKKDLRPRLEEIQQELTDALAAYSFEGVAVNRDFALDAGAEKPAALDKGIAVTAIPAPAPPAAADPRLDGILLLLGHAHAARDLGAAAKIIDMGRELGIPGLPSRPAAPAPIMVESTPEIRRLILTYVRAANARGEGPMMQDVEANVPATTARVRRGVGKLLKEGVLEDRGRYHVLSLWIAPAKVLEAKPAPKAKSAPKAKEGAQRVRRPRDRRAPPTSRSNAAPARPPSRPTKPAPAPTRKDPVAQAELLRGFLTTPGARGGLDWRVADAERAIAWLGARLETEEVPDLLRAIVQKGPRAFAPS